MQKRADSDNLELPLIYEKYKLMEIVAAHDSVRIVDFSEALKVVNRINIVSVTHQLLTASAASGVSECMRLLYKVV